MGRSPCCEKNGLKKGPWTPDEDQKLIDYIQKHGYGNWRTLPKNAGLQRCGKSCRLRWTNYLRPDIKRGRFSFEEEETIIQLHSFLGNKWSAIAARLPGRTDNEIKNYWNTHIRKKLLRMGIDPVTHSPRLDLLDIPSILSSTLYNSSHQMSMSRFINGVQPFVNPEILKLATSLFSSQPQNQNQNQNQTQNQNQNQNFIIQGTQENEICNNQTLNQYPTLQTDHLLHNTLQELQSCNYIPLMDSNFTTFSNQSSTQQLSDHQWQYANMNQDYAPLPSNYNHYSCSDTMLGSSYYSDHHNDGGLNFTSVFTTPNSSPTHLNSSSTYINGSSCSTEDEKEISYCSNLTRFGIPDFLDVNGGFM